MESTMGRMKFILAVLILIFPEICLSEKIDLILIEKAKRNIILLSGKKEIAKFSIALGGSPIGPKRCEGDEKTPEGNYIISSRNSKSSYYKSLKISYPNNEDLKLAKELDCNPGGDIFIHGLPNGRGYIGSAHRLNDWTLGCIAVTNIEIDYLWNNITDGTTVKIVP